MTWNTQTPVGRALRQMLGCTAGLAVLGMGATAANAQDDTDEAGSSAGSTNAPLVVTGSRISVQTGMDTPVPVTALEADELEAMDPGSLIQSLNQLPQFYANETPNFSAFFARGSTSTLNLRGLGVNRTLTLINGRRVTSASAFGGVDVNMVPEAMIRGIESVTGGASAAYGTDAVAGVTNFLLDTDYTGLQIDLQGGITSRGDGQNYEAKLAWGTELGDRGHFLFSAEMAEQDGIHTWADREWYQSYAPISIGGLLTDTPNVGSSSATYDGVISAGGTAIDGYKFDASGNISPFVLGSVSQGAVGGIGSRTSGGDGQDVISELYTVYPDTDRYSIFAYADYELSDNFTVFAQYLRGHSHQFQYATPNASFVGIPTTATIFRDNPFLPAELQQMMEDDDIESFTLRRMGHPDDIGNAYYEEWTTQNIGTIGFDSTIDAGGGFLDGWNIQGYYQYGRSKKTWDQYGLRADRVFAALDAVDEGLYNGGSANGNIICRVTAAGSTDFPGCVPLNLFGRGNASAAAVDYVLGNDVGEQITTPLFFADTGFSLGISDSYTATQAKRNLTTFEQHFAEVSASGEVFEGWAGPVSLALGASYREDSIYQIVRDSTNQSSDHENGHPVLCSGESPGLRGVSNDCNNTVGIQYSKVSNIQGTAKVKEIFAETLVPLFDNGNGTSAALNVAGRWADYSGSGTIWAYKAGLDFSVVDGLRLRGTYSRDVRAANLNERFNKTGGAGSVDDPRTDEVEAINVTVFSGGNPNVNPEKADTFTVGAVFQPEFFPGFSASVDWYQVEISDAIAQLTTQDVVDRCFDNNEQQFCDLITLDGSDQIQIVGNQYVNVAQARVEGVDVEIGYRSDVSLFGGNESIAFRTFMAFLSDRSDIGANGNVTQFAGLTGLHPTNGAAGLFPKFKATGNLTYRNGPFTAFFQGRVIGSGYRTNVEADAATYADNSVPSVFYADMRLAYEVPVGTSSVEVWGSVNNLFDKDPPVTSTYSGFLGSGLQANAGLFDLLGRRFTVGVKFKL